MKTIGRILCLVAMAMVGNAIGFSSLAAAESPPPISQATTPSKLMVESPGGGFTANSSTETQAQPNVSGAVKMPVPFNVGYVQHHPHVYAIFWGSEWNEKSGTREKLLDLFRTIPQSSYGNILTQYFDHGGYVANDTALSSYTDTRVVRPPQAHATEIQAEIAYSIANQPGWQSTSYENLYLVFTPPGTPPLASGGCAYHAWSGSPLQVAYAYVPWSSSECRRNLEPWGAMQVSASHEWAEAATDPLPVENYWGWTSSIEGGEIADICNTGTSAEHAEIASGIFAAKLADNYLWAATGNECVAQDASPVRYETITGTPSVGLHAATLTGTVVPGGFNAYYDFVFNGPEGTTTIPTRIANPTAHYGFGSIGNSYSPVPLSVASPYLKGSTTYHVLLESTSALAEPYIAEEFGSPKVFAGNELQFTTPPWLPLVKAEVATGVKAHCATLHGKIYPEGTETHYQFEYGETTAYGTKVPVTAPSVGAGSSAVPVEQEICGLEIGTTYHFRLTAWNTEGTSNGSNRAFKTPAKPSVTTEAPFYTNTFEPQLNATVDPERADTHYQFEYGLSESYGTKIPVTAEDIGTGDVGLMVNQTIKGLGRNKTYHYRIAAENEVGMSYGSDKSFLTLPPCKGAGEKCLWSNQTTVDPTPILEDEIKSVSCASSTLCVAVGRDLYRKVSLVERWDGSTWSLLQSPSGEIKHVSCASGTASCVAVGTSSSGGPQSWMIYELSGAWRVEAVTPVNPSGASEVKLTGVSCTTTACTAVGSYKFESSYKTLIETWNGSSWSIQSSPNPTEGTAQNAMMGVSCVSASTACVTVGEAASRPVAEGWAGSEWVRLPAPPLPNGATGGSLNSVSCTSSYCIAVGDSYESAVGSEKALAERWNGTSWSILSSPSPSEAKGFVKLTGVSCTSSTACTAAGYYASKVTGGAPVETKTLAELWNGTSWTIQSTPNATGEASNALFDISCTSSSACTSAGGSSQALSTAPRSLVERWNGSTWSMQTAVDPTSATEDEMKSVSCGTTTVCVGVGWDVYRKSSFAERWNGSEWKYLEGISGEIKRVSCIYGTSFCVAVGTSGSGALQSWSVYELSGVWHIDALTPPSPSGGSEAKLTGVSCTTTACTAVGSYKYESSYKPLVERWNGSSWSLQTAPNPAEGTAQDAMLGVSCASAASCLAVGEAASKPVAERWNGSEWSVTPSPVLPAGAKGAKFASVSCGSATSCMAVGDSYENAVGSEKPLVERWNGSSWSVIASPSPSGAKGFVNLTDVSCLSPNSCFAGGYYSSSLKEGIAGSAENKTLVETWASNEWTVQSSTNAPGKAYSVLLGISCTSSIACMAAGGSSATVGSAPSLLAERYE